MKINLPIVLLPLIILSACSKKQAVVPVQHIPQDTAASILIEVTINQSKPGNTIAPDFEGLSFETGSLTNSSNLLTTHNTVLLQLIKNLGPGVLRIGGNSSDNIFWTGHARNSNTGPDSLTTTDVDAFTAFAKATGWKVLFGFNLGSGTPQAAASEAAYVNNSLGQSLYAFQTGNEPDVFFENGHRTSAYGYANFQSEWESYAAAVHATVPNAPFAGPDVAFNPTWVNQFIPAEYQHIVLADAHYYRTGPSTDPTITYQTILTPDTRLPSYLETIENSSAVARLPYRISECNSVFLGGKKGVSNVFASALWALNFMWTAAEYNSTGVNFHGGNGGFYSPVDNGYGKTTAMPEYYAMLAFKYGGVGGTILPATLNTTTYNCSAYACTNAGVTYLSLINMESTDILFTVQPGKTVATIKITRLTAPAIDATTGVTFAGASVMPDGTYTAGPTENHTINNNRFVIKVPAGTAMVVAMQ